MTDERIKEEFDRWLSVGFYTANEESFADMVRDDRFRSMAYYAGFRAAERLAKIEVLCEVKTKIAGLWFDLPNRAIAEIDSMISDISGCEK